MEAGFHLKCFGILCECMWWPASLLLSNLLVPKSWVSSIRLGSRHWEQKCFFEFRQFDVFSIGLICLNFMSCLLLCYSMLYRPSMIRHSKSQLRWWHHVKDPVTTPPANHKDGMDIKQPAGNSLHHRWKGTNRVSYLKTYFQDPTIFAGTWETDQQCHSVWNGPILHLENHYHLSKVVHDFRYPAVCNLSIPWIFLTWTITQGASVSLV